MDKYGLATNFERFVELETPELEDFSDPMKQLLVILLNLYSELENIRTFYEKMKKTICGEVVRRRREKRKKRHKMLREYNKYLVPVRF